MNMGVPAACLEKDNFEEMLRDMSQDMNLLGPAQMGMLEAVNPAPCTLHPEPCTPHPEP